MFVFRTYRQGGPRMIWFWLLLLTLAALAAGSVRALPDRPPAMAGRPHPRHADAGDAALRRVPARTAAAGSTGRPRDRPLPLAPRGAMSRSQPNRRCHMAQPAAHPQVMDFLLTRRSRPARMLSGPAPDRATLERLLTAAARVPDHGKLEPWRFVVVSGAARARLSALVAQRGATLGRDPEKLAKDVAAWADSPVTVAVVTVPRPTDRIPEWEQVLSAGAVCVSLVNAALAQGLGACWLSGFAAYDRTFLTEGLDLAEGERIAGFVHIGPCATTPPERPRPDPATLARWVEA